MTGSCEQGSFSFGQKSVLGTLWTSCVEGVLNYEARILCEVEKDF